MLAVLGKNSTPCKGDTMWFGEYNDKPIEWHVISVDKREKKVLLLADSDCGEAREYNVDSALQSFNQQAFSAEEQARIVHSEGNLAFCLSYEEIELYLPNSNDRNYAPNSEGWWTAKFLRDHRVVDLSGFVSFYSDSFFSSHHPSLRPAVWVSYAGIPSTNAKPEAMPT